MLYSVYDFTTTTTNNNNRDALQFLSELGRRLASSFLFQRISVAVQRFNSVLLHDGFVDDDRPE